MRYENMLVCDLRNIRSGEEAKMIESISNVITLILPRDGTPELLEALSAIQKSNVLTTLYLGSTDRERSINGVAEITNGDFPDGGAASFIVNGVVLIPSLAEDKRGDFNVNGIVILHSSLRGNNNLSFSTLNGPKAYVDFEDYKMLGGSGEVDADFLSYLQPKTVLIAEEALNVCDNVTVELLKEKTPYFVAGEAISCSAAISGYVKANGTTGESFIVR